MGKTVLIVLVSFCLFMVVELSHGNHLDFD